MAKEWQMLQEKEKNEEINVAFAYWDGSSHRKDLRMKKGNTISQFLARALEVSFLIPLFWNEFSDSCIFEKLYLQLRNLYYWKVGARRKDCFDLPSEILVKSLQSSFF